MADVSIYIDGRRADYEDFEAFPLSLTVRADSFTEIATVADSKIDNAAQRLVLPGTVPNQLIEENSEGEAQPTQIVVDGAPNFSGLSRLVQTERSGSRVLGYAFELFGGASSLFAELAGKTLRGLSGLGSIPYEVATIEDSWNYTADSNDYPAVWAPVYYGLTGDPDNNYTPGLLRPHVFIKAIIEQIFSELRVTVDSTLFDTPFFNRLVYLFGVADQWNAEGNDSAYFETYNLATTTVAAGFPATMAFPDEVQDFSGVWNNNQGVLTAGIWEFFVRLVTPVNVKATFEIVGQYQVVIPEIAAGVAAELSIGPIAVNSGAIVRVLLDPVDSSQGMTVGANSYITGNKQTDPGLGGSVSMASCLHGEKITDFLAGISHAFNLAWHYDPVLRILTVDPRFDFTLQGVTYEGFYKRVKSGLENWNSRIDASAMTEQKGVRPFGNYLSLGYKEEGTYWFRASKKKNTSGNAPYLGARFNFSETGNSGQFSENPYFESLILVENGTNISYLPAVIPDDSNGVVGDPTYESGPKMAYFAGEIANYGDWKWNGVVKTTRPVLFQQPKPGNAAGLNVCLSYANYQTATGSPLSVSGLAETFYFRWLVILERGRLVSINMNFETNDIRPDPDLFRKMKRFDWPGAERIWIFTGAEQFQPLKSAAAKADFFELITPSESDEARLVQNTQSPTANI